MAEKKGRAPVKAPAKAEPAPTSGGHLKLIIIMLLVAIVAAAAAGAGVYFFLQHKIAQEASVVKPLIYYAMEPLTSNFAVMRPARFLRLSMTIVTREPTVIEGLQKHLPKIRNDILTLLAEQNYTQLNQPDGKETLRTSLKTLLITGLEQAGQTSQVERVLFTELVMQ